VASTLPIISKFNAGLFSIGLIAFSFIGVHGTATADPTQSETGFSQDDFGAVADKIDAIASADPGYTGTAIPGNKQLLIYRTSADTDLPADERREIDAALMPGMPPVAYAVSVLSAEEGTELRDYVDAHYPALKEQGVDPQVWGQVDGLAGPFVLEYAGTKPLPEDLLAELNKFGKDAALVRRGAVKPLGRNLDTSPFFGGAGVRSHDRGNGDSSECTSGFGTFNIATDVYYMMTAAHCVDPTSDGFAATWGLSGGNWMGHATVVDKPNDVAFVNLSAESKASASYLYDGALGDDITSHRVIAANFSYPHADQLTCMSGATSGSSCEGKWFGTRLSWPTLDRDGNSWLVHGYKFLNLGSGYIAASGDSGGPVYYHPSWSSSDVKAWGIISAGEIDKTVACNTYPRPCGTDPNAVRGVANVVYAVVLRDINASHPNEIYYDF
jgi:hypothetical protein